MSKERINGKCEIRWCKSRETFLKRSTENIGDGAFSVCICGSCFKLFGSELPEPAEVERKCKERYKGDDCDVCGAEMPLSQYSALFGVHQECFPA